MKKIFLLVVIVLLPVFGFGQVDLVRWNNANFTPSYVQSPNRVTASNFTVSGIGGPSHLNEGPQGQIFSMTGCGTPQENGGGIVTSKYIQFTINPQAGYKIDLAQFSFYYRSQGGSGNFQVRYSKDNFVTSHSMIANTAYSGTWTQATGSLSSVNPVLPGETVTIRIYPYNTWNAFQVKRVYDSSQPNDHTQTPKITGTVTSAAPPVLKANNDVATVEPNQSKVIDVLINDIRKETVTGITATDGTYGYTTVNLVDKIITYTSTQSSPGTDSFTYTISNGVDPSSTATVNVTIGYTAPTSGALCGTYYIGTGGHFTTITQAVNYLNANGVSCAVTFLLTNTLYENVNANANGEIFPLTINAINTTSVNTVTFKPAPNKDVTIKVNNVTVSNNLINPQSLFKLNGTDNIIFEGRNGNSSLTLINNDHVFDGNHRTVIWLTNNTDNVLLRNLDIDQGHEAGIYSYSVGIYSGSSSTIGQAGNNTNTNLKIENTNFGNQVIQGIYVNNDNASSTGIDIYNNRFGKFFDQSSTVSRTHNPIYLKGVANFKVHENEIKQVNSTFTADHYRGIYVNGNNGSIYKNIIYDVKRSSSDQSISGIWLKSNLGNNPVNITVYNNFITDVQAPGSSSYTQGAYGLYVESGSGFKIYHNSINLKQENQTTGISSALFVESATDLDVRNNIFNNNLTYSGAGKAAIAIVNYYNNTFAHLDYNNYRSTGVIGIKGSINWVSTDNPTYIPTLALWKTSPTGVGKDAHSTNVQPVFVNENTDLHLKADEIANVEYLGGAPVATIGILEDIDGDIRYKNRPTMGADEIKETHCAAVVTWNGSSWSNNMPNDWIGDENVKVIIAGPYTMGNANLLKSCQLEIIADPNAKLIIGENATYIVEDKLTLNAGSVMIVMDKGSFVQVSEPDENDIHPTATFEVHRKTQPIYRYDFTYWSSPVEGFELKKISPTTLFDKFYSWNPGAGAAAGSWTTHPSNAANPTIMGTGKGYIVRAPQSYSIDPQQRLKWESIFTGKPNNGVKEVDVATGFANKWNLIGNPYPSAIDAGLFLDANPNMFEDGAIYLWTHNSEIVPNSTGSQVYTYSASDYATWNKSGATRAGSGGDVPSGNIASGQSFFIKGKVSNPAGTKAIFNNSMRVKQANQNGQFFRPAPSEPVENWETTGKHRIWLNLTGGTNAFNQTMVGYIENATNGLDFGYDAEVFSGGTVSLYSLLNTKSLTIQGRALPFSNQDEVPLGYKTTLTGTLKISIEEFDGLFTGQNIYLEDKVLNIVHNLKDADYTFTTVPGTFNDRFVLRYLPAAELGIDNPTVDANSIVVFRNGSQIDIKSKDQSIEHVTVYDLLGKVIFDKGKINATSFSTSQLTASNQVVIVKVITDTQAEVVKKVIMN